MLFAHFKIETVNSILTKVTTNFIWQNVSLKTLKYLKFLFGGKLLSVYLLA